MNNFSNELRIAAIASIKAGKATLDYFGSSLQINIKTDSSPLTQADLESNAIIEFELEKTGIPILSEESKQIDFEIRKHWKKYWLVDPLDGTKEFINHSAEYTVNIALIVENYPVMGVIYIPAKDVLYFGQAGEGAYKIVNASLLKNAELFLENKIQKLPIFTSESLVIVASRSHFDENTKGFITNAEKVYSSVAVENYGSSLKFCMIAEGRADVYPRLGPTMEWDITAGHAIAEAAGCQLLKYPTYLPLEYNKGILLNPWFIVFNSKYTTKINLE